MKYQKIRIKSKDGINDIVEFVEQANYILYTITEVEQTHTKIEREMTMLRYCRSARIPSKYPTLPDSRITIKIDGKQWYR